MEQVGLILLQLLLAVLELAVRLISFQLLFLAFVHGRRQLYLHLQNLISRLELRLLGLQAFHLRLLLSLKIVQLVELFRHLVLVLFDTSFKLLQFCGDLVVQRIDLLKLPTALVQFSLKPAGSSLGSFELVALELQLIFHVSHPVSRRQMILTTNVLGNALQHTHNVLLLLGNLLFFFLLLLGELLNESSHFLVLGLEQFVLLLIRSFTGLALDVFFHRCQLTLVPRHLLLHFLRLALQVDNVLIVLLDLVSQALLLLRN
mmetsp:Transcript_26460/g.63768  ORF Transcript_26460/g.63768 Transcript_26460/m.63768 type:complete len:260 (+) Transcript_26460:244-1023(+)